MKKIVTFLAMACQLAVAYATGPAPHDFREFKLSDLPKQYQHAEPGSYANYANFKVIKLQKNTSQLKTDLDLMETGNPLDFALTDDTHYIISKPPYTEDFVYSRLGRLMLNRDGYVINPYGFYIYGDASTYVNPIKMPSSLLPPQETSRIELKGNLKHHSSTVTYKKSVYDAIGKKHSLLLDITPVATNTYSLSISKDDREEIYAKGFIYFDKRGKLISLEGLDNVIIPASNASSEAIRIKITAFYLTNFEAETNVSILGDGYSAGEVLYAKVREDGMFIVGYSNGIEVEVATIYTSKIDTANLVSYPPYYRTWVNKKSPHSLPDRWFATRFIPGYLDKNETNRDDGLSNKQFI